MDEKASGVDGGGGGGGVAAQDYGHMTKKLMNDFFDETEFSKGKIIKHDDEMSEEKRDFGVSEEIIKDDGTEQKKLENKVALFFHVLIEILKEIFEDTNANKKTIPKIGGSIQKIKISETPLTTVKSEEKNFETTVTPIPSEVVSLTSENPQRATEVPTTFSTTTLAITVMESTVAAAEVVTTPITTVSDMEESHLSKINIPQFPTEVATESTTPENIFVPTTPTATTPLISFEVPEMPNISVTESPTKVAVLIEETTTTVSPLTTTDTTVIVSPTPALINFEIQPQIQKLSITQIFPTKEFTESSSTTTSTVPQLPPTTTSSPSTPSSIDSSTTTPSRPSSSSTPSTTQEMHYDDTDDNGIPFWLKVIDGIRCSMRDCSGVLIPTRSPYEQKELKNLTITRFIREHGLPPCPCIELKELQKVLSPSNKESGSSSSQRR
uniref:Uncharacterized protein n=1 Tax=Panagrolaimus superbus TaxID=310955 RepID=A0A914Z0J9_9BILA